MENIELTPNRMAYNAVIDENKNVLITEFKSSPKSPAESRIEKRKQIKKKARKNLRQRKRLSSQTSERSDASQQQVVVAPYNLIEYYGSESASQENVAPFNRSARTESAISPGSDNPSNLQSFATCTGEFSTAGISVHQTPKNVIFVIPEGWASSIEIMRLPMNLFGDSSSPHEEQTNSVGPVRSKGKNYRSNRNTPYCNSSRKDKQGYYAGSRDGELTSSAGRGYTSNPTFSGNIDFSRCYTAGSGYRYEPRDYETTSSSVGPIRRSGKRKAFYTPYGSGARERTNYNSMDSASSSSTNDSYNRTDSSPYYSGGNNYKYANKNESIRCWHCRRIGHIRINCPSRETRGKY